MRLVTVPCKFAPRWKLFFAKPVSLKEQLPKSKLLLTNLIFDIQIFFLLEFLTSVWLNVCSLTFTILFNYSMAHVS